MSFTRSDIRPQMDVYTADNVYLGTVQSVQPGAIAPQGALVPASAQQSSAVNGELLGPMPTQPLGNPGPAQQSAAHGYATASTASRLGDGALVVGTWWGLIGRRNIPLDAVQTVSLERVVLRWHEAQVLANTATKED